MSIKYFTFDENEPISLEELGYVPAWSLTPAFQSNDYDDDSDEDSSYMEGDYDDEGWG